jgi:hypothetical protein
MRRPVIAALALAAFGLAGLRLAEPSAAAPPAQDQAQPRVALFELFGREV